ncbi:hypothetical protein RSAG8_11132, partial [Rhizoctonia solani AG-8 WAC10335]
MAHTSSVSSDTLRSCRRSPTGGLRREARLINTPDLLGKLGGYYPKARSLWVVRPRNG